MRQVLEISPGTLAASKALTRLAASRKAMGLPARRYKAKQSNKSTAEKLDVTSETSASAPRKIEAKGSGSTDTSVQIGDLDRLRQAGNQFFKNKEFAEAIESYSQAVTLAQQLGKQQNLID